MNKQKLSLAILLATITCVSVSYISKINETETNQLTLANIEALSWTEWGHDSGCGASGNGCLLPNSEWYEFLKGDYPY